MHVARAWELPGLIFTRGHRPLESLQARDGSPYFLHDHWRYSTLYRENDHVSIDLETEADLNKKVDRFFEKVLSSV
jgi:hypothetical protein